jgi:molybdopterin molybdotransferase
MIPVSEAEKIILSLTQPFDADRDAEQVNLAQSLGRVLARDIVSDRPFPAWHNSAMDGYAMRHADLEQYSQFEIVETIAAAGESIAQPLQPGQCMRIFTGGMLPTGADTVVMQEDTVRHGDRLELLELKELPDSGANVRQRGSFYARYDRNNQGHTAQPLLKQGTKIGATEIGLLAAAQHQQVWVYRLPRVAIFATGNELVDLATSPSLQPGQIIDSNNHALTALTMQAGAIAQPMGIVGDRMDDLKETIATAVTSSDLVISSGGVSVGDYDLVDRVLGELGATLHIRACAIKPGKPLTFATFERKDRQPCLYFGVPGNPASAIVSFWRFIRGAIAKLRGEPASTWQPQFITATTTADLNAQGRRETYLWGKLNFINPNSNHPAFNTLTKPEWQFQPASNHISGNLVSLAGTNALAVLKINQTYVPAGEEVLVMLV